MANIVDGIKLDFDDVLIVPQRSQLTSRSQVDLERTVKFCHSPRKWSGIPIMASNMSCVSGFQLARSLQKYKIITCLHKYFTAKELSNEFKHNLQTDYAWVSIGFSELDKQKLIDFKKLSNGIVPNICIDVPNGYIQKFVEYCSEIRELFPESIIMAGNVVTSPMVQELIIHGKVDVVKVQIGPGNACRTRAVTGVGYGTISCIDECSGVAHGLKDELGVGLICSDGGCKTSGDVCKAFGAGSDFIMLGSFFAGIEENSDTCEWILDKNKNKEKMVFYGMSSHYAQKKHAEGIKNYRASEGQVKYIDYKGCLKDILPELLGGIRSASTYIGCKNIKDFPKCTNFIRINRH